jgi:riboflavin biosynthesis pyrimidine reductase
VADVFSSLEWPASQTWWRANILLDENGSAAGGDGTSGSLTVGRDRHLLRQIRAEADLVVTGGETVRKEGWHFPPLGDLLVLSSSGQLPLESCPHPERLSIVHDVNSLEQFVDGSDARRVLCEGGPKLLRELVSHGRIDELFVSLRIPRVAFTTETLMDILQTTLNVNAEDFELIDIVTDPDISFARMCRRRVTNGS